MQAVTGRKSLRIALWIGALTISALSCAQKAPVIPDTPAGRLFHAWLDAYNAADSTRMAAYVRQHDPAMSVHTQLTFRQQVGRLTVASVERSEPRHLEIVLRTPTDSLRYSEPLAEYAVVDVTDSGMVQATSTFTTLGVGAFTRLRRMSAGERTLAIDSLVAKVGRNYVLPDIARRVADSLRARSTHGAYDAYETEVSLAHRLNGDLVRLAHDRQLGVEYAWRVPLPPPVPVPPSMLHCGFDPPTILADSVGYLVLHGLDGPAWQCGHAISDAMNAVADARALVIDVREVASGSTSMMAYLASYLVTACTHLDNIQDRRTGQTVPVWTRDGLPGPSFGGTKPLYLLTSGRTFAAAEELVYDLKVLGRATIVGEGTGGGAHVTALGQIGEHLLVRVPVARVLNPATGRNWLGTGVQPDVVVSSSEALATAMRLISKRLSSQSSVARTSARRGDTPTDIESVTRAVSASLTDGSGAQQRHLRGIRFLVDTISTQAANRGPLTRIAGMMEFAGGRGRLTVTAVRQSPPVAVNGVTIADPLAKPGDYYLFDNSGFIVVRPATRTFSSFVFTRAEFNLTGQLMPGAFMFKPTAMNMDTLRGDDRARLSQHAPVSIHWHMQPPNGQLYARGWLEVQDAPAIEAGVARWFEIAAALATRPGGASTLRPGGLEITSVALLRKPGEGATQVVYFETLAPFAVADAEVDPLRLTLPAGYTETPWPASAKASERRSLAQLTGARWRMLQDTLTQRERATCRQPWLPSVNYATNQ